MTKTFTQNDIIRYIYHELEDAEKRALEQQLLIDDELRDQYLSLSQMKQRLSAVELRPSDAVIESVLLYAKTFNLHSV
jgi:anti-sigma factor RsiW